jgi:hypothetical protein
MLDGMSRFALLVAIAAGLGLLACSHAPGARDLGPAGTRVTLRGRVSNKPWQHMMTTIPGKSPEYFDLDDTHQTVIYWATPPTCAGAIEITGTVIEATGPAKRHPSDDDAGAPKTFTERSVDVDSARCVE